MDIDRSEKLLDKYDRPQIGQQTNIIVAPREEIMKALVDKAETIANEGTKDVIDIEPGEDS